MVTQAMATITTMVAMALPLNPLLPLNINPPDTSMTPMAVALQIRRGEVIPPPTAVSKYIRRSRVTATVHGHPHISSSQGMDIQAPIAVEMGVLVVAPTLLWDISSRAAGMGRARTTRSHLIIHRPHPRGTATTATAIPSNHSTAASSFNTAVPNPNNILLQPMTIKAPLGNNSISIEVSD